MNDLNFFSVRTSKSDPGVALALFSANVKEANRQNETIADINLVVTCMVLYERVLVVRAFEKRGDCHIIETSSLGN